MTDQDYKQKLKAVKLYLQLKKGTSNGISLTYPTVIKVGSITFLN